MKNKFNLISLEGTAMIGKSTVAKDLIKIFPNVLDGDITVSSCVDKVFSKAGAGKLQNNVTAHKNTLFVIMVACECDVEDIIQPRLDRKPNWECDADHYDYVKYNKSYIETAEHMNHDNVLLVYVNEDTVPYDIVSKIATHVAEAAMISQETLGKPTITGESKLIHKVDGVNMSIIELVPTLYSFTHKRYDTVKDTDVLRNHFWELFSTTINRTYSKYKTTDCLFQNKYLNSLLGSHKGDNLYLSSYLGNITHRGKTYSVALWEDEIPPIEVVWKKAHYGTMKHNLKGVNQWPTRNGGAPIENEGKYPRAFIRFDWRNPLPDCDECICDEFAEFYVNTTHAKITARLVTHMLNLILEAKGYSLVDLCYFINEDGSCIFSEITPDGMRIQKNGNSFDKDLWRAGESKDNLVKIWKVLYADLKDLERIIL